MHVLLTLYFHQPGTSTPWTLRQQKMTNWSDTFDLNEDFMCWSTYYPLHVLPRAVHCYQAGITTPDTLQYRRRMTNKSGDTFNYNGDSPPRPDLSHSLIRIYHTLEAPRPFPPKYNITTTPSNHHSLLPHPRRSRPQPPIFPASHHHPNDCLIRRS